MFLKMAHRYSNRFIRQKVQNKILTNAEQKLARRVRGYSRDGDILCHALNYTNANPHLYGPFP